MQSTPVDETIIVIARLGDKDSKPNLNKRRLYNIRAYSTLEGSVKRKAENLILAEGKPIKGLGQIEFYVRGQLVEVIKMPSNSVFNPVGCYAGIDGEPYCQSKIMKLFYPCKGETERRKQKQNGKLKRGKLKRVFVFRFTNGSSFEKKIAERNGYNPDQAGGVACQNVARIMNAEINAR